MDAIRDSVHTMSVLSVIVHIQKFMQVAPFTDPHLFALVKSLKALRWQQDVSRCRK